MLVAMNIHDAIRALDDTTRLRIMRLRHRDQVDIARAALRALGGACDMGLYVRQSLCCFAHHHVLFGALRAPATRL